MILVAFHNGVFFRGQSVTEDDIERTKEAMLNDTSPLTFELMTDEEYEDMKALEPQEPKLPSEIELLKEKVALQDMIIDELMFVIIPELAGGIGGE